MNEKKKEKGKKALKEHTTAHGAVNRGFVSTIVDKSTEARDVPKQLLRGNEPYQIRLATPGIRRKLTGIL